MWQSIKEKIGVIVTVIVGILTAAFFLEKSEKESAEIKLLNKDAEEKDQILKQQQDSIEQDTKKTENKAADEKKQPMSKDDTIDMLNKL